MKVAYLFPGQGEQEPGMLHSLPDHPAVAATLAAAPTPDDAGALRSTVTAQVALYLAGVASARALAAEGAEADVVAGHSVGTFAAAVVAGVLTFDEGLAAIRLRAGLMERAFPAGHGMMAVLGLSLPQLRDVLADVSTGADPLYLAVLNAHDQIVSGSDRALGRLTTNAEDVLSDLSAGVASTVRWAGAIPLLAELEVELFVQLPPGDTLARLAARDTSARAVLALAGVRLDDAVVRIHQVTMRERK